MTAASSQHAPQPLASMEQVWLVVAASVWLQAVLCSPECQFSARHLEYRNVSRSVSQIVLMRVIMMM